MKNLITTFISIISVALLVFVGLDLFTVAMQKRNAEVAHDQLVYEIETSDFSNVVINQAIANSSQEGYTLSVYPEQIVENKRIYRVDLKYKVQMPIFGVEKNGTIQGYAR